MQAFDEFTRAFSLSVDGEREIIAPSDEEIARAKSEHPDLYGVSSRVIEGPEVTILVKPLHPDTYKRVISLDDVQKRTAAPILLRDCLVWPSHERMRDLLQRYPGLADTFAAQLLVLSGAVAETRAKKL